MNRFHVSFRKPSQFSKIHEKTREKNINKANSQVNIMRIIDKKIEQIKLLKTFVEDHIEKIVKKLKIKAKVKIDHFISKEKLLRLKKLRIRQKLKNSKGITTEKSKKN